MHTADLGRVTGNRARALRPVPQPPLPDHAPRPVGDLTRVGTAGTAARWAAVRDSVARARADNQERRRRVLAYPDLAARLTEPPLRLADPSMWNGFIPPRLIPDRPCGPRCQYDIHVRPHTEQLNTSPFRRQLVEIAAEAFARETSEQPEADRSAGEGT